jgi:hypothetical protein
MRSKSMSSRARRGKWRFFIGLSVLGLLIVASAGARAGNPSDYSFALNSSATPFMQ